jgi:hypothetical protein
MLQARCVAILNEDCSRPLRTRSRLITTTTNAKLIMTTRQVIQDGNGTVNG